MLRMIERVQIGSADPAGAHGHEHLALERHRLGDVVDDETV
jgi:hypothetical protein